MIHFEMLSTTRSVTARSLALAKHRHASYALSNSSRAISTAKWTQSPTQSRSLVANPTFLGQRPSARMRSLPMPMIRLVAVRFVQTEVQKDASSDRSFKEKTVADAAKEAKPTTISTKDADETNVAEKKKGPKKPLTQRIKDELVHYWHGTKLLGMEIRISSKLLFKVMRGNKLSRREKRQLKRTTTDLARLVPFAFFVIVPFMELLLPVALRLFPNMLPSTFENKYAAEEKKRKLLKVRLEMASFLQGTLSESGMKLSEKASSSDALKEFLRKVRSGGEEPTTEELLEVARLFEDDLTLDNLSRPQLVSMCRYMNINAFGTDTFLRYQIHHRMQQLKRDDKLIQAEGVDTLNTLELQQACQSRGIRTIGVSTGHLRDELTQWLDLHLNHHIPSSLLILSRAFTFMNHGKDHDHLTSLHATLTSLPEAVLNEAELKVADENNYKQMLEVLEEQQEMIEDEKEQEIEEAALRKAEKEAKEAADKEEAERRVAESLLPDDQLQDKEDDAHMTSEQLGELREALSVMSAKSSVLEERSKLQQLIDEHKESEEHDPDSAMNRRVEKMLQKLDQQISEFDSEVGSRMNMISSTEDGRISVADLEKALAIIKHCPGNSDRIRKIVQKLDVDKDGFVELDHVKDLVEQEGIGSVAASPGDELKPRKEDIVSDK